MGFFDKLFHKTDINTGVEAFKSTPGAFLVDVRTGPEFESGHIEGATLKPRFFSIARAARAPARPPP